MVVIVWLLAMTTKTTRFSGRLVDLFLTTSRKMYTWFRRHTRTNIELFTPRLTLQQLIKFMSFCSRIFALSLCVWHNSFINSTGPFCVRLIFINEKHERLTDHNQSPGVMAETKELIPVRIFIHFIHEIIESLCAATYPTCF